MEWSSTTFKHLLVLHSTVHVSTSINIHQNKNLRASITMSYDSKIVDRHDEG